MDISLTILDEQITRINNEERLISLYIENRCVINTRDHRFVNFLRSRRSGHPNGIRAWQDLRNIPIFTISRRFRINFHIQLYYPNNNNNIDTDPDNEQDDLEYTCSDCEYDDTDWQYPDD